MARYRKIDPRIWNDEKFRGMSNNGKLVFLFLLTHPHMTMIGAMRATVPGLAAEMGWSEEAFREAFREALSKGMAKHDSKACFVWLPKFLRYNEPESPNVVQSWRSVDAVLPECDMRIACFLAAKAFAEALGEAFGKAFAKAFPEAFDKPCPNQEQEQEQEQEQDKDTVRVTASQVDAIYNAYPRKVDPEAAKKAIRAAIKRLTDNGTTDVAAYLLARTKAFAASPDGQKPAPGDKDYRKHPATWFNAGSYANEINDDDYGGAPQFSSAGVLLPPPKDDEDYESDV